VTKLEQAQNQQEASEDFKARIVSALALGEPQVAMTNKCLSRIDSKDHLPGNREEYPSALDQNTEARCISSREITLCHGITPQHLRLIASNDGGHLFIYCGPLLIAIQSAMGCDIDGFNFADGNRYTPAEILEKLSLNSA